MRCEHNTSVNYCDCTAPLITCREHTRVPRTFLRQREVRQMRFHGGPVKSMLSRNAAERVKRPEALDVE